MKGRSSKLKSCPECGGDLKWIIGAKLYVCTSCGLQLTPQELMEYKERYYNEIEKKEDNGVKDYVKWWLSKKEKK